MVAQKIILTEEITETNAVLTAIKETYPHVQTYNDVKQVRLVGYKAFVKNQYKVILSKYFSELFIELFIDNFLTTENKCCITGTGMQEVRVLSDTKLKEKTNEIITYMEEGMSKEMAIYLVMK